MSENTPVIKDDPMYKLLREGHVKDFNQRKAQGESCDLTGSDFRGVSLVGIDADGIDFNDCYFRMSNLRGVDLRNTVMDGASIHGAQISGTYFPKELDAREIELSLEHGTRMRYRK